MKLFLKKIFIFFIPLFIFSLIAIGTFYVFDPFKILKHYNEYKNSVISYNEDYIATERYLKNKNHYNSFIFGSSRAGCGFQTDSWAKYLKKDDFPYSFAASNESIYGIIGKIRLINEEKRPMNNVLLVIDTDVTFKKFTNSTGHIYIKHPLVSKETKQAFISEYLKDYIFTGFCIAYLDYKCFHTKRSYMTGFLNFKADPNEKYIAFNVKNKEKQIQTDKDGYYKKRKKLFYVRDSNDNEKVLGKQIVPQGVEFLKEIRGIFKKHNTNYTIIISPLYDQKKINQNDLDILIEIFGKENVYDFSGKNYITNQKNNYYEPSHYRTCVGDEILRVIHQNKKICVGKDNF